MQRKVDSKSPVEDGGIEAEDNNDSSVEPASSVTGDRGIYVDSQNSKDQFYNRFIPLVRKSF